MPAAPNTFVSIGSGDLSASEPLRRNPASSGEAGDCALSGADRLRHRQRRLDSSRDGLEQRLKFLIKKTRKRKNDGDSGMRQVNADGLAAGTTWVDLSGRSHTDNGRKRGQNGLITIVDDDECARAGLRDLIESLEYRAATFASAEEYLASDIRESTALLILDVHLLGLSGPDLQAHLIADRCCPPTVFVTGRFEEQVRKRVTEAGALGYLIKPWNETALLNCIGQVLRAAA
jgi:CheY-like chemotaxis protein